MNNIDADWLKQFTYLETFYKKNRAWPNAETTYPGQNPLGQWCLEQQQAFRNQDLDQEKLLKLLHIDFSFLSDEEKWTLQANWLDNYLQAHDKLPDDETEFPPGNFLGRWVNEQRQKLRTGALTPTQVQRLNSRGLVP